MMLDLTTLQLQEGEGLLLSTPHEGAAWRLDASEGHLWLTSPPLSDGAATGSRRLSGLYACLSEHLRAAPMEGLRRMAEAAGSIHLQLHVPQGSRPGSPAPQAQPRWEEAQRAWKDWQEVLLTGHAPDAGARGEAALQGERQRAFDGLVALVESAHEFKGRFQVLEDECAVCIEPEHQTWSAVVRPDGSGQWVELLLPVLSFPTDEHYAAEAALHALQLNAGPILGPDLLLALDAPDLDDALLVLRKTLPAGSLQADDIKAAMGQMLMVAAEVRRHGAQTMGRGGGSPSAADLPMTQSLHDRFYTHLRG